MDELLEVGDQRTDAVEAGLLGDRLSGVGDELVGARLLVDRKAVLQVGDELLDAVGERVQLVAGVDLLAAAPVLARVLLGLADHPLDLALVEVGRLGDRDGLLLAAGLVLGRDVEDAVGVEVERHLDLRHTARRLARTSTTPSPTSRIETSKVPPARS